MKVFMALLAVSVAVAPIAAHANEWKGVPHASYWPIGTTVSAEMIDEQQGALLGHCEVVSLQTLPKKDQYVILAILAIWELKRLS
jgi:hypothetical protein